MSFHHSAIRQNLGIRWDQVIEKNIKKQRYQRTFMQHSKHRHLHCEKISNIKISATDDNLFPTKFLAAWIVQKRKSGALQFTCDNNFANSIQKFSLLKKSSFK